MKVIYNILYNIKKYIQLENYYFSKKIKSYFFYHTIQNTKKSYLKN